MTFNFDVLIAALVGSARLKSLTMPNQDFAMVLPAVQEMLRSGLSLRGSRSLNG